MRSVILIFFGTVPHERIMGQADRKCNRGIISSIHKFFPLNVHRMHIMPFLSAFVEPVLRTLYSLV